MQFWRISVLLLLRLVLGTVRSLLAKSRPLIMQRRQNKYFTFNIINKPTSPPT
jgi:hypothetical protein